mmetsp:Transcript_9359/g.13932  ORF Transcript_9359/g.13932 Transcript_9359/m.13932 type:complete len:602 (-) Transcript_9359:52-1857(-)
MSFPQLNRIRSGRKLFLSNRQITTTNKCSCSPLYRFSDRLSRLGVPGEGKNKQHLFFLRATRRWKTTDKTSKRSPISPWKDNHSLVGTSHEPPLFVRAALVSTSTALCTPVFPAIGFVNFCLRVALPNEKLRMKLSASIGSIISFACWTIVPFTYSITPLLLPFALSNGLCAGVGYTILDIGGSGLAAATNSRVSSSSSLLTSNPFFQNTMLTGGGIGAFTGYCAPKFLYGEAYNVLYGIDGVTPIIHQLMASPFVTQLSCTTGFIAGCAIAPLLHYPMFGIGGVPWTYFSGLALAISTVTMYSLYRIDHDQHATIAPEGSYMKPEMVPLLNSIVRYDVKGGDFGTYSLSSKAWVGGPAECQRGKVNAETVRSYQREEDSWGEKYTFDNPVLAYLCHYIDRDIQRQYPEHTVTVKDVNYLIECRDSMCQTDWSVNFIMERSKANNAVGQKNHLEQFDDKVEKISVYDESMTKRKRRKVLKSIETVSVGIELILAMKQRGIKDIYSKKRNSMISLDDLEAWVRQKAPGTFMFESDEKDTPFKGESIESQLSRLEWRCQDIENTLTIWEQVAFDERKKKWLFVIATTTTGVLATFLSGMLIGI